MVYFKFEPRFVQSRETKHSIVEKNIDRLFRLIIPKANPNFEEKYDSVKYWCIEYDEVNNFTNREIGLDKNENVIIISPFEKNYGFWVDTNLSLTDYYDQRDIIEISGDQFEILWENFQL